MGFVKLDSKRVIEACISYISYVDTYKKNEIEKAIKKKMMPTTKSFFGFGKYTIAMTREQAEKAMDAATYMFELSERELIMERGIIPYNTVMSIKFMAEEGKEVFLSEDQVSLIKHDLNLLKE